MWTEGACLPHTLVSRKELRRPFIIDISTAHICVYMLYQIDKCVSKFEVILTCKMNLRSILSKAFSQLIV